MKILLRIIVLNYLVALVGTQFFIPSLTIDPSKGLTLSEWIIYVWAVFFIFGSLFFATYMLYRWGISTFSKRAWKVMWFFVILVGFPVFLLGPLLYYVVVFELNKGGVVNKVETNSVLRDASSLKK